MVRTEAETLDDALKLIRDRNRNQKIAASKQGKPLTLAQVFGLAKGSGKAAKARGQVTMPAGFKPKRHPKYIARPKLPHPFRSLSEADKRSKSIEMYADGHGAWGFRPVAERRLAHLFGVEVGQMCEWLFGE
jgi:hypothetical protein